MSQQRMSVVILAVGLVLGAASHSLAQDLDAGAPRVIVGSQVRLDLEDGRRLSGMIVGLDGESIGLTFSGSVIAVPKTAIRSVEIRTGQRKNTSKGAVIGVFVGIAGGFSEPLQKSAVCHPGSGFCSRTGAVAAGAIGGGLVGALIGALIKTDEWSSATIQAGAAVTAGRGSVGLTATLQWPARR